MQTESRTAPELPMPADSAPDPRSTPAASALQLAMSLHGKRDFVRAKALYESLLEQHPEHLEVLHLRGVLAMQLNDVPRALQLFTRAVEIDPKQPGAHCNRGLALARLKRWDAAIRSYDAALALRPNDAQIHAFRGAALKALKRWDAALDAYDRAIRLEPKSHEAHADRAMVLTELGEWAAALDSYDRAIGLRPDFAEAYSNRGAVYQKLKNVEAALVSFDKAIALNPAYAPAHCNRGIVLQELRHFEAALASYDRAIAASPGFAEFHFNRGNVLRDLGHREDAIASYDRAIDLQPDYAHAHCNRGHCLLELARHEAAIASYDRAMALQPELPYLRGIRQHTKMRICDWTGYDSSLRALRAALQQGQMASQPLPIIALLDDPQLQLQASRIWVREGYPANPALGSIALRSPSARIRLGYFSADFCDHAVAHLIAGLLERHHRGAFHVTAFSFGERAPDAMTARIRAACDEYIDVRRRSDRAIAALARELQIDVAVDLMGFTEQSRPGIFALRAAPLQVGYLGYPGTTGAEYMDYLIADRTVVPAASRVHYAEKIITLPHSYLVNDRTRPIAETNWSRRDLDLPDDGFVFCCFNTGYKITPDTFDGWCRILRAIDDSVLWLLADDPIAVANLRREARRRRIPERRLIFAKRMPSLARHLSRYCAADLFLDTLPYNAHTTAADALWAGLPVLTRLGSGFASRVAAGLLEAVGLPELITHTPEEYEERAVQLATDPHSLSSIRRKLAENRLTAPLFDTDSFCGHIEAAYRTMTERFRNGLPPDHIDLDHALMGTGL